MATDKDSRSVLEQRAFVYGSRVALALARDDGAFLLSRFHMIALSQALPSGQSA